MPQKKIESMHNFKYFRKLRKTKRKTATQFFSSFFFYQMPKKEENKEVKNIFIYKETQQESSEDILINELNKPIVKEANLYHIPYSKISSYLDNSNIHLNIDRNINAMLNILNRNKKCIQYFAFNSFTEREIRILLAFSTHAHYLKNTPIFKCNTKPNSFYFIIKGKVSLRSLNPEKLKNEIINNNYKFSTIYKNIEVSDKFNGHEICEDNISFNNFISKTNIMIDQQDDKNINYKHMRKNKNLLLEGKSEHETSNEINNESNENNEKKNVENNLENGKKFFIKRRIRRSLTKDYSQFKKETNLFSKKIVENNLLYKNLTDLQRELSCEINSYSESEFFGDWDLILDKPYQESAYADEDTDLLVLNKKYFDKYLLKHLIKIDNDRKLFLTKRIGFLHSNNVLNLKPQFYDKDKIIYTQFDFANEFYIIYKGRGALKQMQDFDCKKKSDIIYHKNEMKTICLVDSGCVVGLEACKGGENQYDNNFVIIEDNTILYPIKVKGEDNDSYLRKSNRLQLRKELQSLYLVQNDILPNTNMERKKLTREEIKYKKKEDKINNIFLDAKDYFWRNNINENKLEMKIKSSGYLSHLTKFQNNNYKLKFNKKNSIKSISNKILAMNINSNSNRIKIPTRNIFTNKAMFLTLTNRNSNEYSLNTVFPKEDESKKSSKNNNKIFNSIKLDKNLSNNFYSDISSFRQDTLSSKSKFEIYKDTIFNNNNAKNHKFISLTKNISKRYFINFSEEKKQKDNFFIDFHSFDDNNNKYYSMNNTNTLFLKLRKKTNLTKNIVDKYITKMTNISKKKNYNSGYFKIPLLGFKLKK